MLHVNYASIKKQLLESLNIMIILLLPEMDSGLVVRKNLRTDAKSS